MFDLTIDLYNDPETARQHLEKLRWPKGPICPHCGNGDKFRIMKFAGKSTRPGLYKCKECRKPFSVTIGTVLEGSNIPLHKWVLAAHLMGAYRYRMNANQLHRMLDVSYKSACHMTERIDNVLT